MLSKMTFQCLYNNNIFSKAEVACGSMGGRLASFVDKAGIDALKSVIQTTNTASSLWLGTFCACVTFALHPLS